MQGPDLFYESYDQALRDDVKSLGGLKVVGKWFFAEKDPEAAGRALADRLNPERRERLSDEQERMIMRRARESRGFSAALCFIRDDTEFERPKARNPEDERVKLQREILEAARSFKHSVERLERLATAPLTTLSGGKG